MNIVIKNSNNNIYLKKKEKKIRDCPKDTLFQTGFEPATFEFHTYLPNYLTRPNDFGYPTICVFRCFLMHLLGSLTINYLRHYMFSYVISDAVPNIWYVTNIIIGYKAFGVGVCSRVLLLTIGQDTRVCA